MIPSTVRYHRAASLEDALDALSEPEARALAGGQSLLPVMKLRLARPSLLVDVGHLDLAGVELANGAVRIGALTTWDALALAPELAGPAFGVVSECASGIGDLQVRNRGTLGGSLAHADPASDMPAVLLALGADVRLRSQRGERTLAVAELFQGPFTTALAEGELVTEAVVPAPPPGSGAAYASVEHPASGFALAGAAALVRADGSTTIAVTGIGSRPHLLDAGDDPEAVLAGVEVFGDRFTPDEYRRDLAATVVRRAVARARERAGEGRP